MDVMIEFLATMALGASAAKVMSVQFVRLVVAIGFFPSLINRLCKDETDQPVADKPQNPSVSANGRHTSH